MTASTDTARRDIGAKRRAADVAYDAIETMISTLQLRPGTPVVEAEIAESTGLGRTPVREALLRMVSIGLIAQQPRRGLLVSNIDLADHLDKYVGDYSHGMKRKLQLVLATAHRPRLLVLDEPLRGLDPEAAILMNTVIERTAGAGNGVLIATHDLFAAERGCDEVVIVSEGRVVTQGAPAELLERHRAANLEALLP